MITLKNRIELMNRDLKNGATMVIIEARESGRSIGVMGKGGEVDFSELDLIFEAVGLDKTMIEAPKKAQQQAIYIRYGPKSNIVNVQPKDVLSVGALRGSLRGDTISALRRDDWEKYNNSINAPDSYKS